MARVKYTVMGPKGTIQTVRVAPNLDKIMSEAARNSPATQGSMTNKVRRVSPTAVTMPVQNMLPPAVDYSPSTPTITPPSLLSTTGSSSTLHSENLPASHDTPTPTHYPIRLPASASSTAAVPVKRSSRKTSPSVPLERSPSARRIRKLTKRAEESKQQQLELPQRRQVPKKVPSTLLAEPAQANENSDSTTTAVGEEFGNDAPNHIASQSPGPLVILMDLLCVVASSELEAIQHMPQTPVQHPRQQKAVPPRPKRGAILREYKELTENFRPLLMRKVPAAVNLKDPVQQRIWSTSPAAQILMLDGFQRSEVDRRMNARFIGNEKLTMAQDWHRLDHVQRQRILDYRVSKSPKSKNRAGKGTRK